MSTVAVPSTGPSSTPSSGTRCTITPVRVRRAGDRFVPCPLDGVRAGQVAGQGRMEVDHPAGEPAEEAHGEHAHPSGQHDEIGVEAGDDVGETGVVVGAFLARVHPDVHGRHARSIGSLQGEHVRTVRDHGDHVGGQLLVGAGIDDRLEVRAVTRDEYDQPLGPGRAVGVGGSHVSNLAMHPWGTGEAERKIHPDPVPTRKPPKCAGICAPSAQSAAFFGLWGQVRWTVPVPGCEVRR